jgi:hypothetical protein
MKVPSIFLLLALSGSTYQTLARSGSDGVYGAIDAHALAAPASMETSFKTLAAWLTAPCRSDEEKARVIFRWITGNIRYDVDAFFAGDPVSGDAADALKNKTGVCEGYAGLFAELARASGLEAASITGYAKGYGYAPGRPLGAVPNHAWNAVRIGGRWRLLDCTWGAGYVGDDRSFHRAFDPHFFLTPPGEFIFDHFPEDEAWQLLDSPRSRTQFERSVHVKSGFYNLGLSLGTNTEGTLRADGEIVVRLGLTRPVTGVAALLKGERALDDRCAFVQNERNALVIRVMPPDTGVYSLRLFGRAAADAGPYGWVLDYRIESARRASGLPAYPRKFTEFDRENARVIVPIAGVLSAGTVETFRITIPPGDQGAVIVNDAWTFLKQTGEEWRGDVTIQPGTISVCAKHPGREEWETLLEYSGKERGAEPPPPR